MNADTTDSYQDKSIAQRVRMFNDQLDAMRYALESVKQAADSISGRSWSFSYTPRGRATIDDVPYTTVRQPATPTMKEAVALASAVGMDLTPMPTTEQLDDNEAICLYGNRISLNDARHIERGCEQIAASTGVALSEVRITFLRTLDACKGIFSCYVTDFVSVLCGVDWGQFGIGQPPEHWSTGLERQRRHPTPTNNVLRGRVSRRRQ